MKKGLLLICLFIKLTLGAQELEFVKSLRLNTAVSKLEIDQFGNIYLLLDEELRKLNSDGQFASSFSDPVQGNISQVDLLNPMNPLLYYQNANVLKILDNRLNQSREVNLSFHFRDPKSIAATSNNQIWLYDQNADRMILFQIDQAQINNRSPLISQMIDDQNTEVLDFQSGFNQLIIHLQTSKGESLLVLDAQGAFERHIRLPSSLKSWDYYNGQILAFYPNQSLQIFRLAGEDGSLILSPLPDCENIFFSPPLIYFHHHKQIDQYRLISPN